MRTVPPAQPILQAEPHARALPLTTDQDRDKRMRSGRSPSHRHGTHAYAQYDRRHPRPPAQPGRYAGPPPPQLSFVVPSGLHRGTTAPVRPPSGPPRKRHCGIAHAWRRRAVAVGAVCGRSDSPEGVGEAVFNSQCFDSGPLRYCSK